jgi:hypothetical protein
VTHPDHLVDEELSALVDGQLAPDELSRVQAHIGTCLACQARLAEMRELVGLLRSLRSVEPPRDFRIGPRLVVDPPNVIRLRRWYAWARVGAGALAAAFVFLSVGTLYVDSRPVPSSATLASKAQPASQTAPEAATVPQNPSAPAARNAAGGAASDAAAPAPPDAGAPVAPPPPAALAQAAAARPAAVPAASPAAQAPGAAAPAAGAAVRSQAAPAPTSTEPGDQIAAATTVRPLPTALPAPTQIPQPRAPFASPASAPQEADPAAPLRVAASIVGVLAAFGILLALFMRHRLQAASASHLE